MAAYVVVQIDVHDPEVFAHYREMSPISIAAYGGRFLVRGGATTILEGTWNPRRLVVLEFPSTERAMQWWESPEYAEAKALRQTCSEAQFLIVEGHVPAS